MTTLQKARSTVARMISLFDTRKVRAENLDAIGDARRDFTTIGDNVSLMFFTMFFSAVLAMGVAYVLAYPEGVAGLIATMAVESGMGLDVFLPAFGFSLVLINSFFVFVLASVDRWLKWMDQHDDDQVYDIDTVAAMIIELQEQMAEMKRRHEQ